MLGLQRKCPVLNPVQRLCGANIYQLTSGFANLVCLKTHAGGDIKSATYTPVWYVAGETIFQLIAHYAKVEVLENLWGP